MFEPLMESGKRRRDLRSGWVSTAAAAHGLVLFALAAASVFARVDAGTDPLPPLPPVNPAPPTIVDVRLGDPDAGPHRGHSKDSEPERPKPPEKMPDPPRVDIQPRESDKTTVPAPEAPPALDVASTTDGAIDDDDAPDSDGTGTGRPGPVGEWSGRVEGKDATGPPIPGRPRDGEDSNGYGVEPPVLLVRVEPVYPELERGARVEGTVLLEALVGATGRVESVRVLASARPGLTAAAVQAVERWRYRPARRNGRAVGVTVRIEVRFEMR